MRPKKLTKPSGFMSNNLWKLYSFIYDLEKYYLFTIDAASDKRTEKLFYIRDMYITSGAIEYSHYSFGDFPECKMEWLTLELVYMKAGHMTQYTRRLETDAWNEKELPIEEILQKYKLRIPSEEELGNYYYSKYDTVNYLRSTERDEASEIMECVRRLLKDDKSAFVLPPDDDKTFDYLFISKSVPGLRIGGKLVCGEEYTEVSLFYDRLPDNSKMLERTEALERLNTLNAQSKPSMRFYLDDKGGFAVSAVIDYCQWSYRRHENATYITDYLRSVLESAYPTFYTSA